MKKKYVRFFCILLTFIMLFAYKCDIKAEDVDDESIAVLEQSISAEVSFTVSENPFLRSSYECGGILIIGRHDTLKALIRGTTYAKSSATTCKIAAHLQRLVNGSWETVVSEYNLTTGVGTAVVSRVAKVTTGYYYRVTGTHTVITGSSSAAVSNTTSMMKF